MRYLLDADTCISAVRNRPIVLKHLAMTTPGDCAISTITRYELLVGVEKSLNPVKEKAKVDLLVATLRQLRFGLNAAGHANAHAEVRKMFDPYRNKNPKRSDILVKLFSIVLDGITHGLIYEKVRPEENGPEFEWVMLRPRDVMFHPPWDSGQWST
jgi:predicted nucleic acid-binding protein